MHIMEGFLPLERAVFWSTASMPVIAWGFLKIRRLYSEQPEQKMSIAISRAFIFALSSLKPLEQRRAYKDLMNRLAYKPGIMRMRDLMPRLSVSVGRMEMDVMNGHLQGTAF